LSDWLFSLWALFHKAVSKATLLTLFLSASSLATLRDVSHTSQKHNVRLVDIAMLSPQRAFVILMLRLLRSAARAELLMVLASNVSLGFTSLVENVKSPKFWGVWRRIALEHASTVPQVLFILFRILSERGILC